MVVTCALMDIRTSQAMELHSPPPSSSPLPSSPAVAAWLAHPPPTNPPPRPTAPPPPPSGDGLTPLRGARDQLSGNAKRPRSVKSGDG